MYGWTQYIDFIFGTWDMIETTIDDTQLYHKEIYDSADVPAHRPILLYTVSIRLYTFQF